MNVNEARGISRMSPDPLSRRWGLGTRLYCKRRKAGRGLGTRLSESVVAYYDVRDELTVQDSLLFKGPLIVIPNTLRKEMIELVHSTHIGTEGCLRRARDIMYWRRTSTQLKDYVSKCDVCMAQSHRPQQSKEPIQQHEFAARPWSKVGADLCELKGHTLLVVSDYYSNYIEVENISKPNTLDITKALMIMFA